MKLLLVSPFTSVSGSAIRFWHLARHLQALGHEVVYMERHPKGAPRPDLAGIEYHSTPKLGNLYLDIALSLAANVLLLARHRDCHLYYAFKPAPNNCIPALIARRMGKRILLDIDDLDYGYFPPGLTRRISRFFFDHFPRHFDLVTYHTHRLGRYITETLRVPPARTCYLPQGVSDVFLDWALPEVPPEVPRSLIYVATLGITSDFGDLLPMLARLCATYADLSVNVVGDGVRRGEFERAGRELGIGGNLHFLGRIRHEALPGVMAANWLGINYMRPSLTNDCRAILKVREYLAVGLPVVCNRTGDAADFEQHAHVEEDLDGMERRLVSLLERRPQPNLAGRRFVEERYRWGTIVREFGERVEAGPLNRQRD